MYTEDELAAPADTTVDQVRRMAELRIITPGPDGFGPSDIQLVRVADAMDAAGIGLDDIGELIAGGHYSMGWGGLLYPDPVLTSDRTLEQACEDPLGRPGTARHRRHGVQHGRAGRGCGHRVSALLR